jgi:hypothetical protein
MRVFVSRRSDSWRPFKKPVRDKLFDGHEEWLRERSAGLAATPTWCDRSSRRRGA